ncbi:putative 200 kDa antigen p200 [Paraburkholderia tropica]
MAAYSCAVPAGVDEIIAARATRGVVGSEKQHHARDMLGFDAGVQTLLPEQLRFAFVRLPELHLTRRANRTGNHAIHANTVFTEIAREPAREALDSCFGSHIHAEIRRGQMPGNRAEIDDRACALLAHAVDDGLCTKELMAQIHGEPIVPVSRADVADVMTVVVGRVVDENLDVTSSLSDGFETALQGVDITQIAAMVDGLVLRLPARLDERERRFVGYVQKMHARALCAERLHHGGANTGAAARDHDHLVVQARINCIRHGLFRFRFNRCVMARARDIQSTLTSLVMRQSRGSVRVALPVTASVACK